MNNVMGVSSSELGVPTQAMLAVLSHLQALPVKATLESTKLADEVLRLSIALRVQSPEAGRWVNFYA